VTRADPGGAGQNPAAGQPADPANSGTGNRPDSRSRARRDRSAEAVAGSAPPARSASRAATSSAARAAVAEVVAAASASATASARAANSAAAAGAANPAAGAANTAAQLPWYERARSNRAAAGRRHCGHLERILHRDWAVGDEPPPQIVQAVDRLAELPQLIKERLLSGLDAIYVGPGGVPELDDMGALSGVPLPSGRATWDICAGAYGERKVVVGSRPSPTPDVMCHEIGHALDDIDGHDDRWQSDSGEFISLYERCLPSMVSDFHRQSGHLGRREFFADAFAAIASSQRPALVEMVGGNTRAALAVMLYFNVRYGI
jgi:hypothetical protein